jgi:hypothetical protein
VLWLKPGVSVTSAVELQALLVALPSFPSETVSNGVTTAQVAPTILKALGLDPRALDAVRAEGTAVLPEVSAQFAR